MELTDKQLEALDIALKLSNDLLKVGGCERAKMVNRIISCILHGKEYSQHLNKEQLKKYILEKCFENDHCDYMYIKLMQAAFPEDFPKLKDEQI